MTSPFINEASFRSPFYYHHSAWIEHAPFAFWLVSVATPKSFVELGTHGGYSYFAFCQAFKDLSSPSRCVAVDTWKGDAHAGAYNDAVYRKVRDHNDAEYRTFSFLIRSTFDEALEFVPDGSVDLLHVDGRHFYDDVKHDYASWKPKLSDHAIVLFHDISVRERDFGVYKLWDDLKLVHPSFEFDHGNGLGVLAPMDTIPRGVAPLMALAEQSAAAREVRETYRDLGGSISRKCQSILTSSEKNGRNPLVSSIGRAVRRTLQSAR